MTLHSAIEAVLRRNGNRWMTPAEIAVAIAADGSYRRADGQAPPRGQISARLNHHRDTFEQHADGRWRLQ